MRLTLPLLLLFLSAAAHAASERQAPPAGAPAKAPPQFTRFTPDELSRGFMALAFGSDLRTVARKPMIRRFDRAIRVHVINKGTVDRTAQIKKIVAEYATQMPALGLTLTDEAAADVKLHLMNEKNFAGALIEAFGAKIARTFIARTEPQCMTSVQSDGEGKIIRSFSFIIVDRGEATFLDCAYHEMLHALGLTNHDQRNRFTTLNQDRLVGYLSAYDLALLRLLYDDRMRPGMDRKTVRTLLPRLIESLPAEVRAKPGG